MSSRYIDQINSSNMHADNGAYIIELYELYLIFLSSKNLVVLSSKLNSFILTKLKVMS